MQRGTLTVQELIELLSKFPPHLPVIVCREDGEYDPLIVTGVADAEPDDDETAAELEERGLRPLTESSLVISVEDQS